MLTLAGTQVVAVSVGGIETCVELPGFDLCFDIGRCPFTAVRRRRVLVTHAHLDHAGGLATHAALRDLQGLSAPVYYVPAENYEDFQTLFHTWRRLDRSDLPCEIVATRLGEVIPLGADVWAVPFRSPHRVACQGYALHRRRRKLRPELIGRSDAEIRSLRAAGEDVFVTTEALEVVFTGDTVIDVVEREEAVRTARLLIMEVTFLDDSVTVAKAKRTGHVHLDEVIERAALFENEAILFTHFSARHDALAIQQILERRLPASLRGRVTALLPAERS